MSEKPEGPLWTASEDEEGPYLVNEERGHVVRGFWTYQEASDLANSHDELRGALAHLAQMVTICYGVYPSEVDDFLRKHGIEPEAAGRGT